MNSIKKKKGMDQRGNTCLDLVLVLIESCRNSWLCINMFEILM